MKTLLALSLALALGISACGGDNDGGYGGTDTAARNDDASAGTESTASGTDAGAAGGTVEAGSVQEYTFHGEVKKIDAERQMITIDHEKIGDYMEAMTMPFKVADPALLSKVTVGQQTHFTLRVAGNQALITKIEDGHAEGESH